MLVRSHKKRRDRAERGGVAKTPDNHASMVAALAGQEKIERMKTVEELGGLAACVTLGFAIFEM